MKNNSVTMFVAVVFVVGIAMLITVGIANAQSGIYEIKNRIEILPTGNAGIFGNLYSDSTFFISYTAQENIRKISNLKLPFVAPNPGSLVCQISQYRLYKNGILIDTVSYSPNRVLTDGNIFWGDGLTTQEIENIDNWATFDVAVFDLIENESIEIQLDSPTFCNGLIKSDSGVNYQVEYGAPLVQTAKTGLVLSGVNLYPALNLTGTSSDTIRASVISSVQDTTAPLVPVAGAMVGIPVAFVIGRRLISAIRLMV